VAFEIVAGIVEFDDFVVSREAPVGIKRHFALARWVHHAAGHHKFSMPGFLADEYLIGGENHIFEARYWIDGFDLTSVLLQNTTESFPLAACLRWVDCGFSGHVGIFLIDDIEIIRRTKQDLAHTMEW
jgi:hypothetical protein